LSTKKYILILIFLYSFIQIVAQNHKIDSLKNLLNSSQIDTNRVKALVGLVEEYQTVDLHTALNYGKKAIEVCTVINDARSYSLTYTEIGYAYYFNDDFESALEYFMKAVRYYEKNDNILLVAKTDKRIYSELNNSIGTAFFYMANYEKALEYFLKTLDIRESIEDKNGVADCYNNIGVIYNNMDDLKKALQYYYKSLDLKIEAKDEQGTATSYNNIGEIYRLQKDYTLALEYYEKSLVIKEKFEEKRGISTTLGNIGSIFMETGKMKEALEYLEKALKIKEEIKDKFSIAESNITLGLYYRKLENFKRAIEYYNTGHEIGHEINAPEVLLESAEGLSFCYSKIGDYKNAYDFFIEHKKVDDEVKNERKVKEVAQMEMQYEFDKKQKEQEFLQQQRELKQDARLTRQKLYSYISIIGFLLMLISAFLLYRNYNNKKQANLLLEMQKDQLAEEKKKTDILLLNILPTGIVDELKRTGRAKVKQYEKVSVLFTDFVGFTNMCEKISPIELIDKLDKYFEAFDNIIDQFKLEKLKTAGDSYICAGGVPVANHSNPIEIVIAGLQMQDYVNQEFDKQEDEDNPAWLIRLGINTGPVVAGVVGKKKFAFDIWGDTVNIGARMEATGEAEKVNITGSTYEYIKDYFDCTFRGRIAAKNKGEIDMYFVDRIKKEYSQDSKGIFPNERLKQIIIDLDSAT